ncbi:GATA zinc finger domain-containing protein 14-like [Bombina bombina]|uniref:GATA zinc finger domain-containing protein 14-like n=1 Tax=Bombina bombina TaxID=8345 RepID=UPI00235AF0F5|nr:GATA zinc finger domain-containing protein 14-like [Bombina bombina]
MDIFGTRDSILDDIHKKIDPSDSTYNKYKNDTINERDTLSELENILFKEIKQKLELTFLKKYIKENMVPRGLRLKKDCTFELNEEHQKEWYDILETASSKLINVIIKSRESTTQDLGIKIQNCKEILDKTTLNDTLNSKQQEIAKKLGDLNKDILEVKWRKFNRDLSDYKGIDNQDPDTKSENHKHLFSSRKPMNDMEASNNTTYQTSRNDQRERITNRNTMQNRNPNERQYTNNDYNRNNRNNFNRQHDTDNYYNNYRDHKSHNYEYRNNHDYRNQGHWRYNYNHNRNYDLKNREQKHFSTHYSYRHFNDNQRDYQNQNNDQYRNDDFRNERDYNKNSHNHSNRRFDKHRNMNNRHNDDNMHTNWRYQHTEQKDWETPTNHRDRNNRHNKDNMHTNWRYQHTEQKDWETPINHQRKTHSPRHKESHNHQMERNIETHNRYSSLTHENEDHRTPAVPVKTHSSRISFLDEGPIQTHDSPKGKED